MKILIRLPATRSSRIRLFLGWTGILFFLIGILAVGYWGFVSVNAKVYQAYQAQRFQEALASISASASKTESGSASLRSVPWREDRRVGKDDSREALLNLPVGRIEIPRIGLSAMILEGADDSTLRRGVGHIPGSPMPGQSGNVAIAGHRDTFFRNLREVREQDQIILTTLGGSFRYRVVLVEVVEPQNTSVLENSGGRTLTLVTCFPFYYVGPAPERFIVQAQFIRP